jgi:hypothetical protein
MFSLMAYFLQVQSGFDHPFVGVRPYPDSIAAAMVSMSSISPMISNFTSLV